MAFTRNPATGENHFYGEWLANAQGEDVVVGSEPQIHSMRIALLESAHLPSLEQVNPKIYDVLDKLKNSARSTLSMICKI